VDVRRTAAERQQEKVGRRTATPTVTPRPDSYHSLLELQARAGNEAVNRLLEGARGRGTRLHDGRNAPPHVQRQVRYGDDPKATITAGHKDVLYGLTLPRARTKAGLSQEQESTIRTIDEYNQAIGINEVIAQNAAIGLYTVREQLASTGDWGLPLDPNLGTPNNVDAILDWVDYLRRHRAHVGLEDLGEKGGLVTKARIEQKGRFKKNRAESQANRPKADRLTPTDTRRFLSSAHTKETARDEYDAMSPAKQTALKNWVSQAFFRRTSKLGQDFTVKVLGGTVHFNTMADPNYQPGETPNWQERGLETMSERGKNKKNRSITVSEYRHMKKLAKLYPHKFNVYGEI
jgi:hypothetical protein